MYHGVALSLFRRLLRSTVLSTTPNDQEAVLQARQLSREAAQSALTTIAALRSDHMEAFWHTGKSSSSSEVPSAY
jgi:hypothetical protein